MFIGYVLRPGKPSDDKVVHDVCAGDLDAFEDEYGSDAIGEMFSEMCEPGETVLCDVCGHSIYTCN